MNKRELNRKVIQPIYLDVTEPIFVITRDNHIYANVYRKISKTENPKDNSIALIYIYTLEYNWLFFDELSPNDKSSIIWLFNNIVNTQADDLSKVLTADIPERINGILPITFKVEYYK